MKHVYFSGIGGAGIGPLALIAMQAGYQVSGSDKQESSYVANLRSKGVDDIHIGQTTEAIAELHGKNPIDWIVYSSAVIKENPNHPELKFAKEMNITATKRDEFLNQILSDSGQKMIAIAGTHGKTTTTAMIIWLFHELGLPLSYSVGGKLSFGGVGVFDQNSEYFAYEADEYDRNFLAFKPFMSLIPGIGYDHADIYPTKENYYEAFQSFLGQSEKSVLWKNDAEELGISEDDSTTLLAVGTDLEHLTLAGRVNRINAHLAIVALEKIRLCEYPRGVEIMNRFPGVSRRFEKIANNIYTDYAHTPEKILGALQLTQEIAGDNVVVVYEGLHNTRQHFIHEELKNLFEGVKKLYIVPSYLAREDENLEMLTPEKLREITEQPADREAAKLDTQLKNKITEHVGNGDLVLCLTAGGGGSLDEWLRNEFKN